MAEDRAVLMFYRLNTYIQTLPPPSSATIDPSAPPTITQAGIGLTMAPLTGQELAQYWLIESAGSDNTYSVSHLTSRLIMSYDKTTAPVGQLVKVTLQSTASSTWKIFNQRLGGYSIISTADPSIAICSLQGSSDVSCAPFVTDGQLGYQRQRWQLRRTGTALKPTFMPQFIDCAHRLLSAESAID